MLKWLVKWIKKFLKFFRKKQTRSAYPIEEQKIAPPPALTNADLEFLFTQLLEGVHQARGQQWAIQYLQRMEKRISYERWINWLLDFGERLLKSPAPNNYLAEQMVQLGELGIGRIGDLSYDIGIRLLTRNLGNPYWENDQTQDTETITDTTLPSRLEEERQNKSAEDSENIIKQLTPAAMPAPFLNSTQEDYTNNQEELIWEYDESIVEFRTPDSAWTLSAKQEKEESDWVEQSVEPEAKTPASQNLSDFQSPVALRLDELLVRLEHSTSLVQQLASGLGYQSEISINTSLPINQQKTTLEQAEAWFYEGLKQAKAGDLWGAIASYNKAIEIHPNSQEYWFNRGLTLFYLGHFEDAIASYDKAIALKPDFYKCWYYRGGVLGELGHFEDAILCFDKAIEIKFNYPEAWSGRGIALQKLGRPLEAVASYDKAIILQPHDQDNWYYRGLALAQDGRNYDAIASYEKALEIQNDFHLAWYKRGVELCELGEFEDGIASLESATEIQNDFYDAWYALAGALNKVGRYEDAIASYEKAAQIDPNSHEVWIDKGVVQFSLGRWDDAISSWEKALEIKPDYYLGWFNCAVALDNLKQREEAIACYDKAIEFYPQFELAWYNRATLLFSLQRFEEAIASYDSALQIKPDYWEAWIARGNAAERDNSHFTFLSPADLYERGYEEKLASYNQGLKYVDQNTQPEGWGRLHLALGNAYYDRGKRHPTPSYYWQQAVTAYNQALYTLTPEPFAQLHLEVLQNLIKTLVGLGQISQAQELHQYGTDFIQFLLSETTHSDEEKKQLALKYTSFEQLAVDIAVQSGEITQAIEIAERGKNACFTWLLYGWTDEIISPSYQSIQQLLNSTTAIIYWHISPCALRTFIIKYKSPEPIVVFTPVVNGVIDEVPLPEVVRRLVEFEDWLKDWHQQYTEYQQLQTNDASDKSVHSWQAEMEQRLLNLKHILNISAIVNQLEDITNLILIPHCDLHRFPLHALFNISSLWEEEFSNQRHYTCTYLPSIQLGFSFKSQQLLQVQNQPLLIVEPQESINYPTPQFAGLESEVISQMFSYCTRIQGLQATKTQVENALSENYNIFHFTGYVTENFNQPHKSEFVLTGEEKLTIEEICKKPMTSYDLITLSTWETVMTGNQNITTEHVGIVSAFLAGGVNHVLTTVWTVESAAIALVMIEFYRRLQQNKSAVKALAETTAWLKELTAGELKQWYEQLLNQLPQEGQKIRASLATELYRSREMSAQTKLYNHPYYWAAFKIAGKFCF